MKLLLKEAVYFFEYGLCDTVSSDSGMLRGNVMTQPFTII